MKAPRQVLAYRRLRRESPWALLALDRAPVALGLLGAHLGGRERRLPNSVLLERLRQDLEALRAQGWSCHRRPRPIWRTGCARNSWSAVSRRVQDDFARINRELREQIVENEGSRGEVLDTVFAAVPWLTECPVHYWGDIDTHGLAILDRLRGHVPHARSLLMDEATLIAHRELWGHEAKPASARELPSLDADEAALYRALREGRWGSGVRLEQERIGWSYAWSKLSILAD